MKHANFAFDLLAYDMLYDGIISGMHSLDDRAEEGLPLARW